ncbi:MAG TPA: DNA mismatch repair protein MutS [Bacillota bacterium]
MPKPTPMFEQYQAIKAEYSEYILFFRLGDFYEMFFDDALIASRELEIVLTARDSGTERVPMCGVPYHSASTYLAKLLSKGYKVAICEQVEDPKAVKGLVKREVVRVVTPGTVIEDNLLQEKVHNYLAAVAEAGNALGLAYVDLSTGEFLATQFPKQQTALLTSELARIRPAELYLPEEEYSNLATLIPCERHNITFGPALYFRHDQAYGRLLEHFHLQNLHAFGCEDRPAATCAAGAILQYLYETQKNALTHLRKIVTYETGEFMNLDPATRRNLELTRTIRSQELNGSLLGVLDLTVTASGGRLLRTWVEQPLTTVAAIQTRQTAVAELTLNMEIRERLQEALKKTYDLQRILSKLAGNSGNARDLLALKNTLVKIPVIKTILQPLTAKRLVQIRAGLDEQPELTDLLCRALTDDPPLGLKEGGMIRSSFHPELEKLHQASTQGKKWVAALEQQERERTGIKSLKVGYNQVFGYYIEVTKANLDAVPADYIRKQTLANCERFINQTLKEYEDLIINAHDKSIALEYQLFLEIREQVLARIDQLQTTAAFLAELDCLVALAEVAVRYNYVKPEINEDGRILILDGRHPVVERVLPRGSFVPNDTAIDSRDNRVQIITGPNMAGKSTYMRQVALIVLLAHIGSFVPAKSADISLVDRIFTRVGASDDLATGQSTFMVEMNEVAYILNHATAKSFLILDEIGRGTSTFDGLSIAWAVVEFINNLKRIGAKTLVATHYHELTELEQRLEGVKNYHVAVQHENGEITFLRKILPGSAAKSYGIEVAQLAGLPREITDRAREILKTLEKNELSEFHELKQSKGEKESKEGKAEQRQAGQQLPLFELEADVVLEELKAFDLMNATPLEAFNKLYQWQERLKNIDHKADSA